MVKILYLPFCKHWLVKKEISPFKVSFALKRLEVLNDVRDYPVFREKDSKPVGQGVHMVIVRKKLLVITALKIRPRVCRTHSE